MQIEEFKFEKLYNALRGWNAKACTLAPKNKYPKELQYRAKKKYVQPTSMKLKNESTVRVNNEIVN